MGNRPLVTVIIPTFNYGHFITAALESLKLQSYSNWECIVIDDGSTDNTREIVAGISASDHRFLYVYQPNSGMSSARNAGMRMASGEFVQFLDADDLLERRKLEVQIEYLEANPQVDAVYGDVRYFPSDDPLKRYRSIDGGYHSAIRKVCGGSAELLKCLVVDNIIIISSPLLRKRVIDDFGFFDERLRTLEDWEYWLRCIDRDINICYLEGDEARPLIRYHPGSASKNKLAMLRTNIELRNKLSLSLKDRQIMELNKRGIANATFALAAELIRQGNLLAGLAQVSKPSVIVYKAIDVIKKQRLHLKGRI